MSRLEAGRIQLQSNPSEPREIAMGAAEPVQRASGARPFKFDIDSNLPVIEVDRELLQLALRQIVDNAVKYSPPGSPIRIGASRNGSQVLFSVEDKGVGIPQGEQFKIFERFYRSPAGRQNVTGAGLGLAIAKDIVEAHGGEIWVEAASELRSWKRGSSLAITARYSGSSMALACTSLTPSFSRPQIFRKLESG